MLKPWLRGLWVSLVVYIKYIKSARHDYLYLNRKRLINSILTNFAFCELLISSATCLEDVLCERCAL